MLKQLNKRVLFATIAAVAAGSIHAATPDRHADVSVVLVHGAFADGSSWDKIIPILQSKGLKVISVQHPLTSLADDVAATQRVIDAQTGRVVLVGHSWGGTIITQAGISDKVKALVYVAAYAPSEGQSTADTGKEYAPTPGVSTLKPDASGFVYLTPESLALNFAQDLPKAQTALMAATQGPIQVAAIGEKLTNAAWRTKKNYYIVAAKDRIIAPEMEQAFAKKINAKTTVLKASHVPMLSQPQKVADVILDAVDSL